MSDGEKRLRDLRDASDHESKMKASLDKAKTDAAAGERFFWFGARRSQQFNLAFLQVKRAAVYLARSLCPSRSSRHHTWQLLPLSKTRVTCEPVLMLF